MSKPRSLRTRYLWAGMTICLLSLILVSAFSYVVSSRITASLLDTRVTELAAAKAMEFDSWLSAKKMIIEGLAQDMEAQGDFSNEHLLLLLQSKMRVYTGRMQDFYIGFADSRRVLSGVGWVPPETYDARTRPWYRTAEKAHQAIVTEPYLDAMTGGQIITVARALRHDGRLVGVLASDFSIAELIHQANSLQVGNDSYALLIDAQGHILAHPDPDFAPTRERLRPVTEIPWPQYGRMVDLLLRQGVQGKIALAGPRGGEEFFTFSRMKETGWFFGIAMSRAEYMRPLNLLLAGFGAAFVLSVGIGLLVMHRLVEGMIRPVSALTRAVASFSSSNLEVRASVEAEDEIGRLGRSFNAMADTIAEHSRTLEAKVIERTRELQDKNDLIMDSIRYAQRMQKAILPTLSAEAGLAPERCFAIWRPRSTVGGDMYWSRSEAGRTLLVVADCTGHGVPGALMTMTLNSILDATVREVGLDSPARVMEMAHTRLRQNLRQDGASQDVADGADVAMLLLDRPARRLAFCGARLSLFAARGAEVAEYSGNPHCIGYSRGREVQFEDLDIPWDENLRLYFTTDGLLDQNHAPQRSGMGRQGFRHFLASMADLGMDAQLARIEAEIDRRLAAVPQRDDICVLGLAL
ncbi:MAG: cache domain-containing protein [Thermodesulfobacteriota bacterium]